MALINCPECNREINEQATKCPHCGATRIIAVVNKRYAKERMKELVGGKKSGSPLKGCFIAIIVLAGLAVIFAILMSLVAVVAATLMSQ